MLNWLSKLFFLLFISTNCLGQHNDKEILTIHSSIEKYSNYQPEYLFKNSKPIIKFNPITAIPGGLMFLYQKSISPQIFADCLYEESCSKFSVSAIRRYGILKGIGLSADRLTRCNQFAAEDIHSVRINTEKNRVIDNIEWYHKH